MCVVCLLSPRCRAFLVSLESVSVPPRGPRHLPVPVSDTLALSLEPSALPVWRTTTALLAWRECDDCSGFRSNNALSRSYSGCCCTKLCIGYLLFYSEVQEVKRISSVYAVLEHQPTRAVLKFPRNACFSAGIVDCMVVNAAMARMLEQSLMVSVWFKHDTLIQSKMLEQSLMMPFRVVATQMRLAAILIVFLGLTARVGAPTSLRPLPVRWSIRHSNQASILMRSTERKAPHLRLATWSFRPPPQGAPWRMLHLPPATDEAGRSHPTETPWDWSAARIYGMLRCTKNDPHRIYGVIGHLKNVPHRIYGILWCTKNDPARNYGMHRCTKNDSPLTASLGYAYVTSPRVALGVALCGFKLQVILLCNLYFVPTGSVVVPPYMACYTTCNVVVFLMN